MSGLYSPFPASAGMNQPKARTPWVIEPVPRERGDEPADLTGMVMAAFRSPRARG